MWVAHILFSKNISIYAIFNDQNFNDMLTNNILSFEQLGPVFLEEKSPFSGATNEQKNKWPTLILHAVATTSYKNTVDIFLPDNGVTQFLVLVVWYYMREWVSCIYNNCT